MSGSGFVSIFGSFCSVLNKVLDLYTQTAVVIHNGSGNMGSTNLELHSGTSIIDRVRVSVGIESFLCRALLG